MASETIEAEAALEKACDEAREEGFQEGYSEGAADQSGWAIDTAHAVIAWLTKHGDGFDPHHPDGITTDVVIQALYDAIRSAVSTEARKYRPLVEAIKKLEPDFQQSLAIYARMDEPLTEYAENRRAVLNAVLGALASQASGG